MRYCSAECVAPYQRRLDQGTVGKIRCLESQLGDSRLLATRQGGIRKAAGNGIFYALSILNHTYSGDVLKGALTAPAAALV